MPLGKRVKHAAAKTDPAAGDDVEMGDTLDLESEDEPEMGGAPSASTSTAGATSKVRRGRIIAPEVGNESELRQKVKTLQLQLGEQQSIIAALRPQAQQPETTTPIPPPTYPSASLNFKTLTEHAINSRTGKWKQQTFFLSDRIKVPSSFYCRLDRNG